MVTSEGQLTIDIRPAVSVYATYRRLSYQPWYAIAEFVDNSTQSYYDYRAELIRAYKVEGGPGSLRVEVAYDSDRNALTIDDNAHGMEMEELTRAVVLDRPPPRSHRALRVRHGAQDGSLLVRYNLDDSNQ